MYTEEKVKSQETAPGSREATESLHLVACLQRLQKMFFLWMCPWFIYPSLHCQCTSICAKSDPAKPGALWEMGGFRMGEMHKKLPLALLCSITVCLLVHSLHSLGSHCDRRGWSGCHCALPLQCQRWHHIHVLGSGQVPQLKVLPAHYLDRWLEGDRAAQQQVPAERGPADRGRVPDHPGCQGSRLWDLLLPCGDPRVVQWPTDWSQGCGKERWVQRSALVSAFVVDLLLGLDFKACGGNDFCNHP